MKLDGGLRWVAMVLVGVAVCGGTGMRACGDTADEPALKTGSAFYPREAVARIRANCDALPWAAALREGAIDRAAPWLALSDEELWALMFGNTITRSWMVWSNGYCPACKEDVPMYNWEASPLAQPWKVRCPHCGALFPKNDFGAFYRSGLDERGVFDPARADRALLYNAEHPEPDDPLHQFCVDDGEGYVEGENRWRFIGAYLVYGQWKQAVYGGIHNLAAAYVLTGDTAYAHKAGVLLDRVADVYPTFDYAKQAVTYEKNLNSPGYVSIWHDACEETREMALAYDQVFEALRDDAELVAFLSKKAEQYGLENPKASFEDVQRSILRDAIANQQKIHSNYPRTPIAVAVMTAVLGWPENRDEVFSLIDDMLVRTTAVDGVTGEKGLANYSAYVIQSLACFLSEFARSDDAFLGDLLKRHPRLHQTYRFHIDTWCLDRYYPLSGDAGWFCKAFDEYQGVVFRKPNHTDTSTYRSWGIAPSMFDFLWRMYEATGDAAFVKVLYRANENTVADLPLDLFAENPKAFQENVAAVIEREGVDLNLPSVNKQEWRIAVLRSGQGANARALWLDYDSGGGHGHVDGMNLGLFAKGLDLMPDFGYPPVQHGGWGSPRSRWYASTASHNTVLIDRKDQQGAQGETTLWADGTLFHAIRAAGAQIAEAQRYERTAVLIDVSDNDAYVLDVFRVVGGTEHTKFTQSHFGQITSNGLDLKATEEDYGPRAMMRGFQIDPSPAPGWHVDWQVEDRYGLLEPDAQVRLRHTDFTQGAAGGTVEAWITPGGYGSTEEAWIPRVFVQRKAREAPLASTFVSLVEPYATTPMIAEAHRVVLKTEKGAPAGDPAVGLAVTLADERRDLIIAADPAAGDNALLAEEVGLRTNAELCLVRLDPNGKPVYVAFCHGSFVEVGGATFQTDTTVDYHEFALAP